MIRWRFSFQELTPSLTAARIPATLRAMFGTTCRPVSTSDGGRVDGAQDHGAHLLKAAARRADHEEVAEGEIRDLTFT